MFGIGARIRERRMAQGLNQSQLARKAGIAKSYLSRLETTEGISPSVALVQQIATALNASLADLLGTAEVRPAKAGSIPPALARARVRYRFADDEVALLQAISYRGKRPATEDDYFFLLLAIKHAVGTP